jgi:hypothetical protein
LEEDEDWSSADEEESSPQADSPITRPAVRQNGSKKQKRRFIPDNIV